MKVIIAAAGTAGHINPGLSIANKIKEEEPSSEIIFIGTKRGLEKDLVPRAGYELKTIDAYGLSLKRPDRILKTLKGFGEAKKIIKEFKPDVVIGTGGYICGAAITEANKLGVPTMLHESNAFPGKAVKMLAKRTDCIMVGFKEAKERLAKAKNVVVTGNPTKIKDLKLSENRKENIIKELGLDSSKQILLVFGGSQGAKAINDSIIKIVKEGKNKNYQIIWAPGPVQYDIIKEKLELTCEPLFVVSSVAFGVTSSFAGSFCSSDCGSCSVSATLSASTTESFFFFLNKFLILVRIPGFLLFSSLSFCTELLSPISSSVFGSILSSFSVAEPSAGSSFFFLLKRFLIFSIPFLNHFPIFLRPVTFSSSGTGSGGVRLTGDSGSGGGLRLSSIAITCQSK